MAPATFSIRLFADAPEVGLFTRTMDMPFVPRTGDVLGVGRDNEYLAVESLCWAPDQGFTLYLKDLDATEPGEVFHVLGDQWQVYERN